MASHLLKNVLLKFASFYRKKEAVLEGFADANLGGCEDSRKSTTGFVFTIRGTSISWMCSLRKSFALSTTKA